MYVKNLEACRTRSDVAMITGPRGCVRMIGEVWFVVVRAFLRCDPDTRYIDSLPAGCCSSHSSGQ